MSLLLLLLLLFLLTSFQYFVFLSCRQIFIRVKRIHVDTLRKLKERYSFVAGQNEQSGAANFYGGWISPLILIVSAKWNCRFGPYGNRGCWQPVHTRMHDVYRANSMFTQSTRQEEGRRYDEDVAPHCSRYVFGSRERRRYSVPMVPVEPL